MGWFELWPTADFVRWRRVTFFAGEHPITWVIMPLRVTRKLTRLFCLLTLGAASMLCAATADLAQAKKLYSYTDYDSSLKVLLPMAAKDGPAWLLIGQNYYGLGDLKRATEALEKAIAVEPRNSEFYLWLGRAYGRRAETSSPFTAPGYASKARQNFEKSVELDIKNLEACSDLFEYYLEAPGFLGGGMEKATKMAERMAALNETEGHWARAKIAEKRKEYSGAEQQFRRAVELAPQQAGRLLDLAKFLAKQGRFQESDQAFQAAEKVEPNSPRVMFAKADAYIRNGRNLETARKLLRQYLTAMLTPDDPPRAEAEKLLKQAGS
jgi:tetratricopeptide (TPR) repeat protein